MEVRFKNFRAFQDTGPLKLKKITLLVGENSSGKTSFLAGLNHLSKLLEDETDTELNSIPFELGSFKDVLCTDNQDDDKRYFEYECKIGSTLYRWVFEDEQGNSVLSAFAVTDNEYQIKITVDPKKSQFSFEMSLLKDELILLNKNKESMKGNRFIKGNRFMKSNHFKIDLKSKKFLISQKALPIWTSRGVKVLFSLRSIIIQVDRPFFRAFSEGIDDDKFSSLVMKISNRLDEMLNVFTRQKSVFAFAPMRTQPSRVYSYGQSGDRLSPDGSHMANRLVEQSKGRTQKENSLKKMLNAFGRESRLFKEIFIKRFVEDSDYPFSIMVKTNQDKESNIMDVGYGVSQILPIILDIIYSSTRERMYRRRETRFLLQQPEVHLHPRAQAAFGSLLARLVKESDKEFIVETHSDFILDRLKYEIAEGNISKDDVGILFFDTEKKKTKIWQIELNEEGIPESPPASYRRFFLEEGEKVWL